MNRSYIKHWNEARDKARSQGLEIVESGWEQHVILDHAKGVVYRYPRHASADTKLADEVGILKKLNEKPLPVAIPKLIKHHQHYSTYRIVKGDVLGPETINRLAETDIQAIGHSLGEFLAELHATNPEVVHSKQSKQTMSLISYYSGRINRSSPPPVVKKAAVAALSKLREYHKESKDSLVFVHGDLHGLNTIIDPTSKRLAGVIDFSEVEIGDRHQDLRKVFMTDARLLDPAIHGYLAKSGIQLNRDLIITWAAVNEWSNVCHFWNRKKQITYQRALANLKNWGYLR